MDDNIQKFGYHSTFVSAEKTASFCYSTEIFKNFGIPKIFISSLSQNLANTLIESYVDKFRNAVPVPFNMRLDDLTETFPVYLIEVPEQKLTDYVLSSIRFYSGNPYKYIQLIYPDKAGHLSNDAGYDYDQIILGQFVN